jgi:RNA polymerase sigma factor (sigma-70 family)
MSELDDHQLLAEFARENSEAAFAALVQRHVNLVYSVALQSVGNVHAAEEITQAVFIVLARKAKSFSRKTILSGWLYQTTRLTAANFLRGEIRRQNLEQEAYMQSALNEPEPDIWPQIAPLLDDALAKLGGKDRDAIVLRFFENKNLREVGMALGASEDAAKMRVNRALEKLRNVFRKRGVTLTSAAIAGAVSANSVQAAPVGLAATISATAVKSSAVAASTLTLVKGALKIMAWTKAKTAIVTAAVVVLAAGTTTPIVVHVVHQREAAASLFTSKTELTDADNANYQQQTGTTPAQVAQAFFDACAKEDWSTVGKFWQGDLNDGIKKYLGGMEVVSLGKPFKARISIAALLEMQPNLRSQLKGMGNQKDFQGPQVFIPYEIRLKDGTDKKWQLSIRSDNPEHRWYFDGGL